MCGICGMVLPGGLRPGDVERVAGMARRLVHRGPDNGGLFADGNAALGARRLSIVDVEGGAQPIGSEDGAVQVVFNGEIYNHRALRRPLEAAGHRFRTGCDTEVLVHAYEERGPDFLAGLNGIFALAIWDARARRLLLARDPLGVKPLYWTDHDGGLAFASEVKALLDLPGARREVDPEALDLYLAFRFVPSPRTLFRGVFKLAPGQRLILERSGRPRRDLFAPPPEPIEPHRRPDEWAEAIAAALREAVRRQLMADVPVGVLLSGGADSASMLAIAGDALGAPVHAYTVGFEDAPDLDEVADAASTARRYGAAHRHVRVADSDYRERFAAAAFWLDEPVATPSIAPYDALCQLAASERKVVLSGQGADEPFGGYPRHLAERLAGPLGRLLAGPAAVAARLRPGSERLDRAARSLRVADDARRYAETLALFPAADRRRLLGADGPDPADAVRERIAPAAHLDPLARFLYLDARFGLADDLLLYADKVAMAHSLEVRVPFLDLELLRLVESIPGPLRVRGLRPKHLLRRALRSVLPAEVLARSKRNFAPPSRAWLQGDEGGCASAGWLREPGAAARAYCRPREIDRLLAEQREGRRDRRRQIFALLAFEIWHRTFIDRRLPEPAPAGRAGARPAPRPPPP
jgi:asparagine synthase (glutamine-hydrolysing)